jgi:UDP-2,4-diacetamido-2,4,6-trideoxy-beta-L-altropyranose hydrolase
MKTEIVFRLDAGTKSGYGHLSRCLSLADELFNYFLISLIIKSDDESKVLDFIRDKSKFSSYKKILFLDKNIKVQEDLLYLNKTLKSNNGFLILDHYSVDEPYQLFLKQNGVKWLQFDSHAKQKFYGDFVLHASPGATETLYKPLVSNQNSILLLGTKYAIVSKSFQEKRLSIKSREKIKNIIICFGGGNDGGATSKCLDLLNEKITKFHQIYVITTDKNPELCKLEKNVNENDHLHLIVNCNHVYDYMAKCDVAIITPGTLSYEAACLGLPMLLITIAENQNMNAKAWAEVGAAINLGSYKSLTKKNLNSKLSLLINNPDILNAMSVNSLNSVDGNGASRVRDYILSIL